MSDEAGARDVAPAAQRVAAPAGAASGEVVLIPKHLRMDWTDTLALDPELSHLAFRVAAVIGSHFNRHRGDTFVSQETLARVLAISPRSVWNAIAELERRGYLIVERRGPEADKRTRDGRRVCGGRGIANTYRPACGGQAVAATDRGRRLAERAELAWERGQRPPTQPPQRSQDGATFEAGKVESPCDLPGGERSQNRVGKVARDCDPTLEKINPGTRARAGAPRTAPRTAPLGPAGDRLRHRIGGAAYRAWFHGVAAEVAGDCVILTVASGFDRSQIIQRFGREVVACWQAVHPAVTRLEVLIREKPR